MTIDNRLKTDIAVIGAGHAGIEAALASARLGSLARSCRCDRQGRLSLARSQLESVGISKNIKLIGAVTHIRICAPEKWEPDTVNSQVADALTIVEKRSNDNGALAALIEGVLP